MLSQLNAKFLSTLPARGATQRLMYSSTLSRFLSTLPARGATLFWLLGALRAVYFYPRSPRGERRTDGQYYAITAEFLSTLPARGATTTAVCFTHFRTISIHAPREGSDNPVPIVSAGESGFLSTLPARGATT